MCVRGTRIKAVAEEMDAGLLRVLKVAELRNVSRKNVKCVVSQVAIPRTLLFAGLD